jgi:hypothetical protein
MCIVCTFPSLVTDRSARRGVHFVVYVERALRLKFVRKKEKSLEKNTL